MKHTVKKLTKKTVEKYAGQGKVKFVPAQLILDLLKQFLSVLKAKKVLLKLALKSMMSFAKGGMPAYRQEPLNPLGILLKKLYSNLLVLTLLIAIRETFKLTIKPRNQSPKPLIRKPLSLNP